MPTAIDVSVDLSAMVYQKRIDAVFVTDQPKLFDRSRLQLLRLRDDPSSPAAFCPHSSPVPQEKDAPNDQTDEVEREKNQGEIDGDFHARVRGELLV